MLAHLLPLSELQSQPWLIRAKRQAEEEAKVSNLIMSKTAGPSAANCCWVELFKIEQTGQRTHRERGREKNFLLSFFLHRALAMYLYVSLPFFPFNRREVNDRPIRRMDRGKNTTAKKGYRQEIHIFSKQASYPTGPFEILGPQNPPINELYVVQKRRRKLKNCAKGSVRYGEEEWPRQNWMSCPKSGCCCCGCCGCCCLHTTLYFRISALAKTRRTAWTTNGL